MHEARCSGWVELGTQPNRFGKAEDKPAKKVLLTFCVRGAAGESWRISREFTLSAGPRSGLRKLLEEWRGRPYVSDDEAWNAIRQPLRILEQPGLVRISHRPGNDGRVWPQIEGVWPLMKGQKAEALKWPPVYFTLAEPCRETFQSLLPWVQAKIRASAEWAGNAQVEARRGVPPNPSDG